MPRDVTREAGPQGNPPEMPPASVMHRLSRHVTMSKYVPGFNLSLVSKNKKFEVMENKI
jgi:hypothetical protein